MRAATMHSEAASGLSGPKTPAVVLPLRFCALDEGCETWTLGLFRTLQNHSSCRRPSRPGVRTHNLPPARGP